MIRKIRVKKTHTYNNVLLKRSFNNPITIVHVDYNITVKNFFLIPLLLLFILISSCQTTAF